MIRLPAVSVLAFAIAILAGCGGSSSNSAGNDRSTTSAVSQAANTIYERAYTECSSTDLGSLAGKYKTKDATIGTIVRAVGIGWAERYGGGPAEVRIGESGCRDGLSSRPDGPGSA